jgi:fluoroacetyl-CoA thioesterase
LKKGLFPGHKVEFQVTVDETMFAEFDGHVVHPVMSTVSMIYYMERAGRFVILPFLLEEEEGAGYEINVKHLRSAVKGQVVTFRAVCTEVTERRVICEVTAETDSYVIGKGTFTQAIFLKEKMRQNIEKLQANIGN